MAITIQYLRTEDSYDHLIGSCALDCPLLSHRAESMKRLLFPQPVGGIKKQTDLEKLLIKHTLNIELHLSRMYRIRNTIIHNAAINLDIASTAANLKYYLTFILCYTITELTENREIRSTEDYFVTQEIMYNSLLSQKFPSNKLFEIKTHFEFIT